MFRALLLMSCIACSMASFAQTSSDPVRVYAESMARLIVADDASAVFDNFAPIMRSAYSRAELLGPLKRIREQFGEISSFEYRTATAGGMLVGGHTLRTVTCWYAAATKKFPTGPFLKIEVTYDQGRFYLAGYSVESFVGDHIPQALRGTAK